MEHLGGREEPEKLETGGMFTWLQQIGRYQGSLLIVAGAVYVLGYLIWSFTAWRNNLGLLPALDAQYFLAGAVPALLMLALYLALRGTQPAIERAREQIGPDAAGLNLIIRRAVFVFVPVVLIAGPLLSFLAETFLSDEALIWAFGFYTLAAMITMPLVLAVRRSNSGRSVLFSWTEKYLTYQPLVLSFAIAFYFYVSFAYPNLPQEFGGRSPRCAYLDVAKEELSTDTRAAILPAATPAATPESSSDVVRSSKVDLLFSGGGFIVVRRPDEDVTYEIRRDAVRAIVSCGSSTTEGAGA